MGNARPRGISPARGCPPQGRHGQLTRNRDRNRPWLGLLHLVKLNPIGMEVTRIRTIGAVLAGTAAAAALPSSSALAALPEWSPASGRFSISGAKVTLEARSGTKVTCKQTGGAGSLTGAKTSEARLVFTGCESSGIKCSSARAGAGEIVFPTDDELSYISKAKKEVAITLQLSKEIRVTCSLVEQTYRGSSRCQITPVNKATSSFTVACEVAGGSGLEVKPGGTSFEPATLSASFTFDFETSEEIKA
jgi:hypothetical protein